MAATTSPVTTRDIQDLDPTTLLVDVNIRHDNRLDKDFVASIRDHGVLQPIVAVRTAEGGIRVRLGHRRTLAAVEAGRATVPVIVVGDEVTDDAGQIDRLVCQYAENAHRTGLSGTERLDVVAQLAAFGVSAAQITKRTRMPRAEVNAALTVTGSDLATAATARYEFLTLEQAAVIAEFDSDEDVVTALVAAAKTGGFDHVAQRARDQREEREAIAVVEQTLTANGLHVVSREITRGKADRLDSLTDDPDTKAPLTADTHAACPGHAAYITETWVPAPLTRDDDSDPTGDGPDDQDVDAEDTEDDEPDGSFQYLPVYVCTDPEAHGHHQRYTYGGAQQRKTAAGMTDDERETARAERCRVITNNKSWESAEKVRRSWLATFAARKTAPKGTATFLSLAHAHDADTVASIDGNTFAANLLGLDRTGYGRSTALQTLLTTVTDQRAQVIHLVQVLAAYETASSREDWRRTNPRTARYLQHLAALGYTLSDVEHLACGITPDSPDSIDDTDPTDHPDDDPDAATEHPAGE